MHKNSPEIFKEIQDILKKISLDGFAKIVIGFTNLERWVFSAKMKARPSEGVKEHELILYVLREIKEIFCEVETEPHFTEYVPIPDEILKYFDRLGYTVYPIHQVLFNQSIDDWF